jgi:60 kDa SS-A/Ro ribonucleoprotein
MGVTLARSDSHISSATSRSLCRLETEMSYLEKHGSTLQTPQDEPMEPGQVENSAGGFVWAVDGWTRLRRFLILGSEGGSYYATERDLTRENVGALRELAQQDGERLVAEIVQVSQAGRAPSNDPALFALAVAISAGDKATKKAAAEALPLVARIGTHLYHFATYLETQRGWGRTAKWAIRNWYETKGVSSLAYDAVKYRQRDGWSHRDLLRLAKPTPERGSELDQLFAWIVGGSEKTPLSDNTLIVNGFERAQRAETPAQTASLCREYVLPREALKTEHLTDPEVWRALLDGGMPIHALTRNLANMTRLGVLEGDYRKLVVEQLADGERIRKSRLHPLALLVALATYGVGHGMRSTNTWTPLPVVIDALDAAFYLAFDNVEATGKRILLALDVSGSMASGNVAGSPLTPRGASAALALVTLAKEKDCEVVGFTSKTGRYSTFGGDTALTPLGLSSRQRLDDAVRTVTGLPFGGTDCALPMLYAQQQGKDFDSFVVLTDSETWAGSIHPKQALDQYRRSSQIDARCAVVGMVSNGFSIADPNDAGMMDVVGMDTATPNILSDFIAERI